MSVVEREPITASESERPALRKLEGALNQENRVPRLIGPDGEEIELPLSVFQVLRQIIYHMMRGRAISIVPINKELTTQEAADILNVSRPYFVKLLEEGKLPFTVVGTHRRVRFKALMEYKLRYEAEQDRNLDKLTQLSEELGLYDE